MLRFANACLKQCSTLLMRVQVDVSWMGFLVPKFRCAVHTSAGASFPDQRQPATCSSSPNPPVSVEPLILAFVGQLVSYDASVT